MEKENPGTRYWIVVASRDHVQKGMKEGIAQACHGKSSPLKRMKPGDYVIYYSGKMEFGKNEPCKAFTGIGKVKDSEVYAYQMTPDFCPSRRDIEYLPGREVSIIPLIEDLRFIRNKKSWGYPFRFGFTFRSGHQEIFH